jgi:sphingomyelin phosphodiesterase acid-like 3
MELVTEWVHGFTEGKHSEAAPTGMLKLMEMADRRALRIFTVLVLSTALMAVHGRSQTRTDTATVPVLMVSDIHFEPFWDPAKVQKLAAAPVPLWEAILAAPESADRAQQFAALQKKCKTRGEDTSFPLLRSSLSAMKTNATGAKFITLSGDLISHAFPCKFEASFANPKADDYRSFVEKTIGFVEMELRKSFPQVPVYSTLGNNDSDCEDYKLDSQSPFLSEVGSLMTADVAKAQQKQALTAFTAQGNYSALLPAPMRGARLLAIDDLFQSRDYKTCGGKADSAAGEAQISWLRDQLTAARQNHEAVWVMGHIPPGINPYSTIRSLKNICAGESTTLYLSSDALGSTIAEFGDVVKLAVFGHSHMDEMRLVEQAQSQDASGAGQPIALKMVPSISPVDGNNPSFMVARVNAATATLEDYSVITASNQTGVDTKWTEEYAFRKAYGKPDYSGKSVAELVAGFRSDPQGDSAASGEYLKNYFMRDASLALKPLWPQYVCTLANRTTETYRDCLCGAGK